MGGARRALPPSLPLPAVVQTFAFWRWPLAYLTYCRRRYGPRFTLHATSQPPLVFLSDEEDIRTIFAASPQALRAGEGGQLICPIVGERSFMLADDERHRRGRRTVLAELSRRRLGQHTQMVTNVATSAVAAWPKDTVVALHPRLRMLTLEVILRTITGCYDGDLDGRLLLLRDRILAMLDITANPMLVEPHLRRGPGRQVWQRFLRNRALVDKLLHDLVDEAPANGLLLHLSGAYARQGRTDSQELRDSIMSLVLAGHETTASQLAWAFQLLAHNPAIQRRLAHEVIVETAEEYLTATIQETLRHRCVFLFAIPRSVASPIKVNGRYYQPPARLLPCIYLMHHDSRLYPQPHTFRPTRFLEAPPDPRKWLPWGGGSRRCPGLHLAMLEMETVLRAVLAHATVEASSLRMEHPSWRSVIVTPHGGSRVILRCRRRS
jgi:cytochrome P450